MAVSIEGLGVKGFDTAGAQISTWSGAVSGGTPAAGDFFVIIGQCNTNPSSTQANVPTIPGTEVIRANAGGSSYAGSVYGPLVAETDLDDLPVTAAGSSNWTIYTVVLVRGATALSLIGSAHGGSLDSLAIGTTPGTTFATPTPDAGTLYFTQSAAVRESGAANWALDTVTPPFLDSAQSSSSGTFSYYTGASLAPDGATAYAFNTYRTAGVATVSAYNIGFTLLDDSGPANQSPDYQSNFERRRITVQSLPYFLDGRLVRGFDE